MSAIDKFMPLLMDREEEGSLGPIIEHNNVTFMYIKYNNLYRILFHGIFRLFRTRVSDNFFAFP